MGSSFSIIPVICLISMYQSMELMPVASPATRDDQPLLVFLKLLERFEFYQVFLFSNIKTLYQSSLAFLLLSSLVFVIDFLSFQGI